MAWKLHSNDGQDIDISQELLIGRHTVADVVLDVAEVSRKHAGIGINEQGVYVIDLGSSNGTFVNDERISDLTQLKHGDRIRFAVVEYQLIHVEDEIQHTAESTELANDTSEKQVSPAEQMNEQGMPSLSERAGDVQVNREGMPQSIGVPKPAPIPEGVDIHAKQTPQLTEQDIPPSDIEQHKEEQKNAYVGLITIVIILIIAVIAFFAFK